MYQRSISATRSIAKVWLARDCCPLARLQEIINAVAYDIDGGLMSSLPACGFKNETIITLRRFEDIPADIDDAATAVRNHMHDAAGHFR
jgi:hypothetical protein